MKQCIIFSLVLLIFTFLSFSGEITLQNGLNDYAGCDDIHIGNSDAVPYLPGSNNGSYNRLAIANFEC